VSGVRVSGVFAEADPEFVLAADDLEVGGVALKDACGVDELFEASAPVVGHGEPPRLESLVIGDCFAQ
jgi:hypothetical protein